MTKIGSRIKVDLSPDALIIKYFPFRGELKTQ